MLDMDFTPESFIQSCITPFLPVCIVPATLSSNENSVQNGKMQVFETCLFYVFLIFLAYIWISYFLQNAKKWLFGHDFWMKNARWPINGCKDLYYSLVSTKTYSQTNGSWFWWPGPGDFGQKFMNLPPLWCPPQKKQNPILSNLKKYKL